MKYKFVIGGSDTDFYKVSYKDIDKLENAVYLSKMMSSENKFIKRRSAKTKNYNR